ncbi:MAG: hypothetical protein JO323_16965 [Acidobacteriia bacterium]|nr:hypothetical protein [Terriglobia bacterium]
MDAFIRHAEQILETAVEAQACGTPEYLIAVSANGPIRVISETAGWSLAALSADSGATAVYKIARRLNRIVVEGWSAGRTCMLSQELTKPARSRPVGTVQMALAPLGWLA